MNIDLIIVICLLFVIYVVLSLCFMYDLQMRYIYNDVGYIIERKKAKLTTKDVKQAFSWPIRFIVSVFDWLMYTVGPILWLSKEENYFESNFKKKLDKYLKN